MAILVDTDGDEISDDDVDGKVITANINSLDTLIVHEKSISNLKGIEAFTSLTFLGCINTQITSLDVSKNTALIELYCGDNQLKKLDVSGCLSLTTFKCGNNQLISLDVSQNTALTNLGIFENQLTSLDLTQNVNILELHCAFNLLESLNIKNGNNTEIFTFYAQNNPNLYCIEVDD